MNLDELKERFKSEFDQFYIRISETPWFLNLKDQYENLSPTVQKIVLSALAFLVLFFIFSTPLSSWNQASENISQFEEKRALIRQVLSATREAQSLPSLPRPPAFTDLKERISSQILDAQVGEDQITSIESTMEAAGTIPVALVQEVLDVELNKLNVKQIVDLGYLLQNVHPAVKLQDMTIRSDASMPKYFSVKYRLASLKVPEETGVGLDLQNEGEGTALPGKKGSPKPVRKRMEP